MNEQFECFVRDVYKPDESIAKWKINKKIETLNYYENKNVTVLFLNIDVSKKVYHKGKKRNVYISAERLKNLLRNKYSKKIQNYFADNISAIKVMVVGLIIGNLLFMLRTDTKNKEKA